MDILQHTDEVGDCIMWTSATTAQGYPIYKPAGCGCTLVRRKVFELNGGVLKPRQPVLMKCDERLCVNFAHMRASTSSEVAQRAAARGAWSGFARGAKIAQARRNSPIAKLTMDIARTIRMSDESGPVLAARYGVTRGLINGIKLGKSWKDHNSMFIGLMR